MVLGQSQYEFPTLLHLAANFGFQEFATKLIDLPESRQAYHIRNLNGLLPEVIARNSGHLELARLFQDFHIVVSPKLILMFTRKFMLLVDS